MYFFGGSPKIFHLILAHPIILVHSDTLVGSDLVRPTLMGQTKPQPNGNGIDDDAQVGEVHY